MQINLGNIFSWFGKKKKNNRDLASNSNEINLEDITLDAVQNCCEQMGIFEDLNIKDDDLIIKICEDVTNVFNSNEKSIESLKFAFAEGFKNNSFIVNPQMENSFVDCYFSSYIYMD
ncbi:MAG: hypothetical protein ACI4PF_01705 [Christensenellales bacterium]